MGFSLGDRFNTASISGATSTYQQSQYNLPGQLFENSTNTTANQSSTHSNLTSEDQQTYYDQNVNVDTSSSETEKEKGGLFQWLYDNVYGPQLEVQQQQAEMELQATAPVVDAYEAVYKYATDETVRDATNLALKTSAQTATVDVVASFKSAALTLGSLFASSVQTQGVMDSYAGSNPLGVVTNEKTAQMMREDVQKSNEQSQETFTQVIEPMIANIYLDAENWKEEHIYNVNVNGTNLTVRQYIANYSVIKEGSLIWNLEASIVNMLPYMIVNVVAGPVAGTCTFAVQCFGGSINSAYAGGATFEEALCYAALSTFVEVSIERVSAGLGGVVGTKIANNGAIQSLLNTAKNNSGLIGDLSNSAVMRTIANLFSNSIGEGIEEVISDIANPFICKMTYLQEEDLAVLWADSKDQMVNDFLIGALSSGLMQSPFLYNSVKQQRQNIQSEQQKTVADMVTEYNNLPQGVKTVLNNIEQRMATDLDHATITEADMQAMLTTPSLLSQELSPEFKTGAQIQTDITSVLENTNIQANHLDSTAAQQLGAVVTAASASTVSSVLSKADTQNLNQRLSLNPLAFDHLLEIGLNASLLVEDGKNNSIKLNGVYDIHNFLIDHNSTYKQAWEAISSNKYVNCNLEMATNNNSYYQKNQGVRIDNDIILSNSIETYFHEVGHALLASNVIDFKIKNRQFNQLLKKHKKSIMRNQQVLSAYNAQFRRLASNMANQIASQKKFNFPAERVQYVHQLIEGIERNSGFTAISDIYDAVTSGKAQDSGTVSYGHGKSYYTSSRSRFHEIFANFHAILCINNPTLTRMAETLLGDEIWNFLVQTYNEANNIKITAQNVKTTDARSWFTSEQVLSESVSNQQDFNYVIQNMSQKYPGWLHQLQTYARDGNLNLITRYNNCRDIVQRIPLQEFKQMVNSLDIKHIITSMAMDQMMTNLPKVVTQFLSNNGNAYQRLININTVPKNYPSKWEYDRFMNKFSEQNGYHIFDQNGYFKHIKYGVQPESIEHRLYINCEPTDTYRFLEYFVAECKKQGLSFYFKTAYLYDETGRPIHPDALTRSESAVIYMSEEHAIEYINICKKIKYDHPELNFYAPPIATGSIDGWLGYGKEPSGLTRQVAQNEGIALSFNSIRSRMLERGIYAGIKDCISKNMNLQYQNGYTLYGALANELYQEIITQYPNLSSESQSILYNNLFRDSENWMKAINSSSSSFSFYARAEGSNQFTTFVVNSTMVNTAAIHVYADYLANDPAVYTYIKQSIKKEASYYHIDIEHLYMDQ